MKLLPSLLPPATRPLADINHNKRRKGHYGNILHSWNLNVNKARALLYYL